MTMPRRLLGAVAISASAASLAIPGVASARAGDKTFQQTYPLASKLCASVAAGTEGKQKKKVAAQILADCSTLQSDFTAAQGTVLAARAALLPQIAADRVALSTACPTPKDQKPACLQTRSSVAPALKVLRHQLVTAARHYYKSIEASRQRFWSTLRALPGQGHAHADQPITVQQS